MDKSTSAYQYTTSICDDYIRAQANVNRVQKKVNGLREEGNYKIMGKVIHDEMRKASIKRNTLAQELQNHLDQIAKQETE